MEKNERTERGNPAEKTGGFFFFFSIQKPKMCCVSDIYKPR
jgi:hypothetical protein